MYQNLANSNNHHRSGTSGMQEVIQMCSSFDNNKSTKGASKLRRDLINGEIANLRDLLPLPSSTRQRLSQLQLMALVCVYVRKANYFQQVFKRYHELGHPYNTPNIGFSKALSGFLIMMTQNGKLLYISDNAAEYLGHSMEDLLIHGDSVYDIIDKADHGTVQAELLRSTTNNNTISNVHGPEESSRLFLCRMNVSRNARRQMRFGDQKVVLLQGHYLSYLPLCSRNEPVFVATCTPVAMPETRESVVQGATNIFTSIHSMDMKYMHIDKNGEHYLGYTRSELGGISWYQLIHWNYMREAQSKHRLISQSEQEKSCILLLRLQTRSSEWIWVHVVLQVKDGSDSTNVGNNSSNSQSQQSSSQQQSIIVATNQVLSDREAEVMRANAWIYHYYTVQTKLQYGLAYTENSTGGIGNSSSAASPQAAAAAARLVAAAAYFPSQQLINYGSHHQSQFSSHQLSPEVPSGSPTGYVQNGSTYSTSHPSHTHYYHTHAYEMPSASTLSGGPMTKDSPLDFSLAATPTNLFEFHSAATYPGSTSYWAHHQYSHNGSTGSSSGYTRTSDISPNTTSSSHNWSNQNQSNRSSTASATSGLSPKLSNSSVRKRTKKSSELVNQSSSSPSSASSLTTEILPKRSFFSSNIETTVGSVTTTTIFPYHTHNRARSLYKLLGSGDEESTQNLPGMKEDTSTNSISLLSCPLTPSPIWEGQAQRVPDLQYYSSTGGDSNERVHCVPTYHHYHLPPPVPGVGHNSSAAFNYYGLTLNHNHPYPSNTTSVLESGSPNKENRLPPTPPESDNGRENEDSKPLKWESL